MIPIDDTFEPAELRAAFSHFPSGVVALAAEVDGAPVGLVASSFTVGVSLDPALVLFAIQNSSSTWPVLSTASHIGVSVLAENHDAVCSQLASKSGNRFDGLDTHVTEAGAVLVTDSPIWFECTIDQEVPAGDHRVVFLRIRGVQVEPGINPLVFHRSVFRKLVQAV